MDGPLTQALAAVLAARMAEVVATRVVQQATEAQRGAIAALADMQEQRKAAEARLAQAVEASVRAALPAQAEAVPDVAVEVIVDVP